MLLDNLEMACHVTGFLPKHAHAALRVANQLNCIILFREPGPAVQGLIAEGHAMKGFRIDTKSCDWGPMSGFVCMDPRLTKNSVYEEKNKKWTKESLSGEINKAFFGDVKDSSWKGGIAPIVLSPQRVEELTKKGVIKPTTDMYGHKIGVSTSPKGSTTLPWRLIPVGNRQVSSNLVNGKAVKKEIPWLRGATPQHMVLCINTRQTGGFDQQFSKGLPEGTAKTMFGGYEVIMGLTNPGTEHLGFKACVTADYDLLAVWPGLTAGKDMMGLKHVLSSSQNASTEHALTLPGGVARMRGIDDRLQANHFKEHHRFGDVSARIMHVKTMLNSAIQNPGGNAVHHNDEAGNVALAKGSLLECLPSIGFVPSVLKSNSKETAAQSKKTVLLNTVGDFRELLQFAREYGFAEVLKPGWYGDIGMSAPKGTV